MVRDSLLFLKPCPPALMTVLHTAGNFSGKKEHEFVVARGSFIELLKQDASGKLETVSSLNTFCNVRSLTAYRQEQQETDYLVIGSDSGNIPVLQYKPATKEWSKILEEPFGKSGARRVTPGQFVAREPSGKAILVAALEKQKFIYEMDRQDGVLKIHSPVESHKATTLLHDVIGLDNGGDHPLFACLEQEYSEADPTGSDARTSGDKSLTFLKLESGLKNVARWSLPIDPGANALVPVPGERDGGPGGCFILAENWVIYRHPEKGRPELQTAIPRRADYPGRGLLLTCHTAFRSKSGFFALAQSECGDVYKITVDVAEVQPGQQLGTGGQLSTVAAKVVTELRVKYFDTLPVASSMAISRNGLLFLACESGDQLLMSFASLGEDDTEAAEGLSVKTDANGVNEVFFETFPVRPLRNLVKVDDVAALGPITDLTAMVPADSLGMAGAYGMPSLAVPQLVAACGRGARSTLRVLQQGTHVAEIGRSGMPGAPLAVLNVQSPEAARGEAGHGDKFILLSFSNATVTMSVGNSLEEVPSKSTHLVDNETTLAATTLPDGSLVQVTPSRLRRVYYTAGAYASPVDWKHPLSKPIIRAAVNGRQVVIACSGGELFFFEYAAESRQLAELKRIRLPGAEVAAVALPQVPEGATGARFVAIADSNNMARILSLDRKNLLEQTSGQALRSNAESLALVKMRISGTEPQMHLFVGLANGVLTRLKLDLHSGLLSDPRVRYLGMRPVRLVPVSVDGREALLALSHRPYIAYNLHESYHLQALCYDALDAAAPLSTPALPGAFVAVAGNSLRIFQLDALGRPFHASTLPLERTPRRMAMHYPTGLAVLIESDHNALTASGRAKDAADARAELRSDISAAIAEAQASGRAADVQTLQAELAAAGAAMDTDEQAPSDVKEGDPIAEGIDSRRVAPSPPRAEEGSWASVIRLVDLNMVAAQGGHIIDRAHPCVHARLELEQDEAAFSVACVAFHDAAPVMPGMPPSAAQTLEIMPGEQVIVVGVAKGLQFHPQFAAQKAYLHTYKVVPEPVKLDPLTGARIPATAVDVPEGAVPSIQYSLRLLHKTEVEALPLALTSFQGMLLAGVGRVLRMYELGRRQLLRKCEARGFPTIVRTLSVSVDRVFVGDGQESVHFCKYKRGENTLHIFADDTQPRHMTCTTVLDHDTVAGGDKFGNLFILRLPASVSDDVDAIGPTGSRLLWDSGKLGGAPTKASMIAQFYVGSAITSLSKAVLTTGGSEVLVYTTMTGAIGVLMPLATKEDADFYTHLELFLRADKAVSAAGRDHLSYRSLYGPVSVCVLVPVLLPPLCVHSPLTSTSFLPILCSM